MIFMTLVIFIIILFRKEVILENRKLNNLLLILSKYIEEEDSKYIVRKTNKVSYIGTYGEFTILYIKIFDNEGTLYSTQDILLQIIDLYSKDDEVIKEKIIICCKSKGLIETKFHTHKYYKDLHGTVL